MSQEESKIWSPGGDVSLESPTPDEIKLGSPYGPESMAPGLGGKAKLTPNEESFADHLSWAPQYGDPLPGPANDHATATHPQPHKVDFVSYDDNGRFSGGWSPQYETSEEDARDIAASKLTLGKMLLAISTMGIPGFIDKIREGYAMKSAEAEQNRSNIWDRIRGRNVANFGTEAEIRTLVNDIAEGRSAAELKDVVAKIEAEVPVDLTNVTSFKPRSGGHADRFTPANDHAGQQEARDRAASGHTSISI